MAHTNYDSIREMDKERNGCSDLSMTSIERYMMPPPFGEPIVPKMEHIRNYIVTSPRVPNSNGQKEFVKCANKSNRIRVKNIDTGVSFEFLAMINAARFVGTTGANMRCGMGYATARVYRPGEGKGEYVFEYDGVERPLEDGSRWSSSNGLIEVVSSTGRRRRFDSYLSVARQLGLLVGHVIEEEKRWNNNQFAKRYVTGKEDYTIEFKGERRDKDHSSGIVCHWKGIYDGDWEKICRIKVTYGKPIIRDNPY